MRITGGTLRGRTIECPQGEIRPTMDRVRESLFGILGPLDGMSFLDLFGGSGIVSLEACSRGAYPITLVEKDTVKIETILQNVSIADRKITCKFMSAELFLKRNKQKFDIVFCDPPFPYKFHEELIHTCAEQDILTEEGIFLLHRPREYEISERIDNLFRYEQRVYGRSVVDFYRKCTATP